MDEATEYTDRIEVMVDSDLAQRISDQSKREICSEITGSFFTPRVISIGPHHHGKSCHLAEIRRHKSRFLRDFLSRKATKSLEYHRNKLRMMEQKIRDEYVTKFDLTSEQKIRDYYVTKFDLTSDQFIDIVLMDGCFILEFLIKIHNQTPDEIFKNESLLRSIKADLLMINNQIPFLVLEILRGDQQDCIGLIPSIDELVQYYFWETKDGSSRYQRHSHSHQILLYSYLQLYIFPPLDDEKAILANPKGMTPTKFGEDFIKLDSFVVQRIPSAKELKKCGVVFKAKRTVSFLDITFHKGILEMPILVVDEPFLLSLINLTSFEHRITAPKRTMLSYCYFMSYLLRHPHDVAVLRKYGIIERSLMTDTFLTHLFHQLQHKFLFFGTAPLYFVCLAIDLCEFHRKSKIPWRHYLQQMIETLWWSFMAFIIFVVFPTLALATIVLLIFAIVLLIK